MKARENNFGSLKNLSNKLESEKIMRGILLIFALLVISSTTFANEIYIEQVGDNLDLDIVQDGQNNEFGDSTTDATLNGDDMVFSITQTGDTNKIDAIILLISKESITIIY